MTIILESYFHSVTSFPEDLMAHSYVSHTTKIGFLLNKTLLEPIKTFQLSIFQMILPSIVVLSHVN